MNWKSLYEGSHDTNALKLAPGLSTVSIVDAFWMFQTALFPALNWLSKSQFICTCNSKVILLQQPELHSNNLPKHFVSFGMYPLAQSQKSFWRVVSFTQPCWQVAATSGLHAEITTWQRSTINTIILIIILKIRPYLSYCWQVQCVLLQNGPL